MCHHWPVTSDGYSRNFQQTAVERPKIVPRALARRRIGLHALHRTLDVTPESLARIDQADCIRVAYVRLHCRISPQAAVSNVKSKLQFWLQKSEEDNSFKAIMAASFIQYGADSHFPIQNLPYGVFSTASNVSIQEARRALSTQSLWIRQYKFVNIYLARSRSSIISNVNCKN